ncbi:hypothetical protein M5D96_013546, partial [Drosophila gunungcola]
SYTCVAFKIANGNYKNNFACYPQFSLFAAFVFDQNKNNHLI